MKLDEFKSKTSGNSKSNSMENVRIRNKVKTLISEYCNDSKLKSFTKEDIIEVVIDECIKDAKHFRHDMLDMKLTTNNVMYLNQLKIQLLTPIEVEKEVINIQPSEAFEELPF